MRSYRSAILSFLTLGLLKRNNEEKEDEEESNDSNKTERISQTEEWQIEKEITEYVYNVVRKSNNGEKVDKVRGKEYKEGRGRTDVYEFSQLIGFHIKYGEIKNRERKGTMYTHESLSAITISKTVQKRYVITVSGEVIYNKYSEGNKEEIDRKMKEVINWEVKEETERESIHKAEFDITQQENDSNNNE